jgi:hypothetical protein
MTEIKRPNYFTAQFLVENDFRDEQAYHLTSRQRNNRVSRTSGVADGFAVTLVSGNQAQIARGIAIDQDGREIVLDDPVTYTLGTRTSNSDVYLTIAYREVLDPADEYPTLPDKFTRTTERPLLQDGTTVPPADGSVIVLARIHLNAAGNIESNGSIDTSVRTVSSAKLGAGIVKVTQLGDGAVTTPKLSNYAVGSAKLDGFARGQHGVFLETFEELPSDWTAPQGTGVESIVASGESGGKALRVVGHRWRVFPQNIPFDPSKLYRIRARFRPIAHSTDPIKENVYIGVQGVAADGITLVNISGVNTHGSQHYVCVAGLNIGAQALGSWLEFTGWFRGHAAVGSGGGQPDPTAPGQLHTNVRYFRPLFIVGFNGGDGTAEVDSIAIDVFDENAVARTYSGLNADGTVAANKVVATSIADGAVTTSKLADVAVTTPKLADLNVTGAKLAANAVDASKIQDGIIGTSKLTDGAVTLAKLANSSVDGSKIASGAVGADKLASGSVGISALAVQVLVDAQFTLTASGDNPIFLVNDSTETNRLIFVSIINLTLLSNVSWRENITKNFAGFTRQLIVTNSSGATVTVHVKAYSLLA